jgi:hypothetical protein
MALDRTYMIETTKALFTLVITEASDGGRYKATYVGTRQKVELPWVDNPGLGEKDLDGEAEDVDFDVLILTCHRQIAERGGEILGIQDISVIDERPRRDWGSSR